MRKRVAVITDDIYLTKKIELTLFDECETVCLDAMPRTAFDTVIVDKDFTDTKGDISMSRSGDCDLAIPFTYEALRSAVLHRGAALKLVKGEECAILHGKKIKLTEVEYSLLSYLVNKGGFADKRELLKNVWCGITNEGIINVYIHYLREKLEASGEKIIICARGQGYKIDEKYLKEG